MRAKLATERGDQKASENLAVKFMRELGGSNLAVYESSSSRSEDCSEKLATKVRSSSAAGAGISCSCKTPRATALATAKLGSESE